MCIKLRNENKFVSATDISFWSEHSDLSWTIFLELVLSSASNRISDRDAAFTEIGFSNEGVDKDTISTPTHFNGLLQDFTNPVFICSV